MARVGVSNLCYAIVKQDDDAKLVYEELKKIAGTIELNVSNSGDTSTLYADNGAFESANALGDIKVDITISELPVADYCTLIGHKIVNGIVVNHVDDVPPDVALGFERVNSKGKRTRTWLLKGSFSEPDDKNKTKEEKVNFNTESISGTFKVCQKNGYWKVFVTEGTEGIATNVFDSFLSLETLNSIETLLTKTGA